jgi:dolichol-phosphate mannosyltransferase
MPERRRAGSQTVTEANRNDRTTTAGKSTDRGSDHAVSAGSTAGDAGSAWPVVVIIPTYNELDNLEDIVSRTRRAVPDADILVVDDNSPDGTGELAEKFALADDHVRVLHRTQKAGLGAAYLAGFDWALGRGYEVLVEMDADGSHDPAELPAILAALADADLAVGSRWVTGGTVRNWPRSREILSRGGNAYARIMLRLSVHDATGGYRAYRAATLRRIGLHEVRSQGYCFQIELTLRTARAGLTIAEVPITFTERARGTSKMSRAIVAEALWRVTVWSLTGHGRARQESTEP